MPANLDADDISPLVDDDARAAQKMEQDWDEELVLTENAGKKRRKP